MGSRLDKLYELLKDGMSALATIGAAVFVIGALAVTARDQMVGLPTAWSSYQAYVRVGVAFVPDSLWSAAVVVNHWAGSIPGRFPLLTMAIAAAIVMGFRQLLSTVDRQVPKRSFPYVVCALYLAASVVVVLQLQESFALLDEANRRLLFHEPDLAQSSTGVRRIHAALTSDDGDAATLIYGQHIVICLMVLGSLPILGRFARIDQFVDSKGALDAAVKRTTEVLHIVLKASVTLVVLALPLHYGVLRLGTSPPCMEVWRKEENLDQPGTYAFLLSDLAANPDEIQMLRLDRIRRGYFLEIYRRDDVRRLRPMDVGCGRAPNFLAPPVLSTPQRTSAGTK